MNDTIMLDGVVAALKNLNSGPVYEKEVKQGFTSPSFYANRVNTVQTLLGNGFKRVDYVFDLIYYCDDKPAAYAMGETLSQALLEVTTEDGLIRGNGMNYQYIEDALHFYVTYPVRMRITSVDEFMEKLKVEGSVTSG